MCYWFCRYFLYLLWQEAYSQIQDDCIAQWDKKIDYNGQIGHLNLI